MSGKLKISLLIFLAFGCGNNHSANSAKKANNNTQILPKDIDTIIYDTPTSKSLSDSLTLSFESEFQKDSVKVSLGQTNVFKNIISTDNRIGFATSTVVNKNLNRKQQEQTITIRINNDRPITIRRYKNYRAIFISKLNGRVEVLLSNKMHYYK
jgi:hypothetical protein